MNAVNESHLLPGLERALALSAGYPVRIASLIADEIERIEKAGSDQDSWTLPP